MIILNKYLVQWAASYFDQKIISHTGVVEVFAENPQEATKIVYNVIRINHPEYGYLSCNIVPAQEDKAKADNKDEDKKEEAK